METSLATRAAQVPSWLVTLGLVAVSAIVLVGDLSTPDRIIFDETYYVDDARGYLATGVEPSFAVHPPVGKWLIAAGIQLVGDVPTGWRLPGALAGVLLVVVLHRLALRLMAPLPAGRLLAAAAPLLLLFDGVFLVQARTAMLDIFLALFVAVGIWMVVVDRDVARLAGNVYPAPGSRRFRLLAGVAFGLALGVKWSGLLGLGVAGLLVLTWELSLRQRATGDWWRGLPRLVAGTGLTLVVVPLVVYAATWIPWAAGFESSSTAGCDDDPATDDCTFSAAERAAGVWRHQDAMLGFHAGLEAEHPYRSLPATWPLLQRPVVYYYETCSEARADGVLRTDAETGEVTVPDPCVVEQGEAGEIILLGNPVTWWLFLLATPLLVVGVVQRDRRSLVPLLGWAGQFLPWLTVSRAAFLFYMVPAVAFQALGLAVVLPRLRERGVVLWPYLSALFGGVAGFGIGRAGALATDASTLTPVLLATALGWFLGALAGSVLGIAGQQQARPAVLEDDAGLASGVADPTVHADGAMPADARPAAVVTVATTLPDDTTESPGPLDAPSPTLGLRSSRLVPALTITTLVLSLGLYLFFEPVWTGEPLPRDQIQLRWWFDSWV
jgi:dolichyl-phosphate-mannose--protein O-mannosyl transferase